ncbi:MAG: hypothetical protein WCW66_06465 [Patescibacteria group bacterium]
MSISLRERNLQRTPSISRKDFHELAAKMMDRKGVTGSVKEGLKKSGVFYGKRNLTKHEFEDGLRKFTKHLGENGVRKNPYLRKMEESLKGKSGFVAGSEAVKAFKAGVQAQTAGKVAIKSLRDLDPGDRRELIATFINKGGLSKQKRKEMEALGLDPDEGTLQLKKVAERIMARNRDERARDIEAEGIKEKEANKTEKDNYGSVESYHRAQEAKDDKGASNSQGQPAAPKTVQLQGGIGGSLNRVESGIRSPEVGTESEINAIEEEIIQNSQSLQKNVEMPDAEHSDQPSNQETTGESEEIDDMQI